MVEPKLPKLKFLKTNPMNGKILLRIGGNQMIQVDPKYFGFVRKINSKNPITGAINNNIVITHEYTPHRNAHTAQFHTEFYDDIVWDCMAISAYSERYQKWLNSKASTRTAIIECGNEDSDYESSSRKELKGIEDGR